MMIKVRVDKPLVAELKKLKSKFGVKTYNDVVKILVEKERIPN